MMKTEITIKAYASIIKKYPELNSRQILPQSELSVSELFVILKIDRADIGLIVINNLRSDADAILRDGDTLQLFPFIGGG